MSNSRLLSPSQYLGVPKLDKYNYCEWALKVEIHLFGLNPNADYLDILEGLKQGDGTYAEPVAPTDMTELEEWNRSQWMVYCLIVATAGDFHAELMLRHRGKPYEIWKEIKEHHKRYDGLLRRQAWMELLAIRKKPNETNTDLFRRVKNLFYRIKRLTPENQTDKEWMDEITICAILNGLRKDDYVRKTLTAQDDLSLDDIRSAFERADAEERIRSMNAAVCRPSSWCYMFDLPGHVAHIVLIVMLSSDLSISETTRIARVRTMVMRIVVTGDAVMAITATAGEQVPPR